MSLCEESETVDAANAIRTAYETLKIRLNKATAENESLMQYIKFLTAQNKTGDLDDLRYPSSDADTESSGSPRIDHPMSKSHPVLQFSPLFKYVEQKSCCCINCCKTVPCTCQKLSLQVSQYGRSIVTCDASVETNFRLGGEGWRSDLTNSSGYNNSITCYPIDNSTVANCTSIKESATSNKTNSMELLSRCAAPFEHINQFNAVTGMSMPQNLATSNRLPMLHEPDECGQVIIPNSLQTHLANAVSTTEDFQKQLSTLRSVIQLQNHLLTDLLQQQRQKGQRFSAENVSRGLEIARESTAQCNRNLIGYRFEDLSDRGRCEGRENNSADQLMITSSIKQNYETDPLTTLTHSINHSANEPMSCSGTSGQDEWMNSNKLNELRICPLCNRQFDSKTKMLDFERHVNGHFSDNDDLDGNYEVI